MMPVFPKSKPRERAPPDELIGNLKTDTHTHTNTPGNYSIFGFCQDTLGPDVSFSVRDGEPEECNLHAYM